MSSLPAGAKPTSLDLKGTSLPALALVLRTTDLAAISEELEARLGDTPQAFENDPVVIDLSPLTVQAGAGAVPPTSVMGDLFDPQGGAAASAPGRLDLPGLVTLLRRHGLQAVAVRGGTPAQIDAALSAGLAQATGGADAGRRDSRKTSDSPGAEPAAPAVREVIREVVREVEVIREIPAPAPRTVVIDKPLRSGQRVYAKGADLVVLALVNHGAEVIADGNVHVYAPLRGKAIAGARGNTEARIYASCLEAELIAIAGIYRTTEEPLPADVLGKPAQVRLEGEKLIMQALVS